MTTTTTTDAVIQKLCPGLKAAKRAEYVPLLEAAMEEFEISTPARKAAFLAQICHESGGLRWMREIWGPTDQQRKYEPPSSVAASLGNTLPGDGKRYLGRGPIQVTGRANARAMGKRLGLPLEEHPELMETPAVAFRTAGAFWKDRGLNELADEREFSRITRRINGGTNGMTERLALYQQAQALLA